MPTFATVFLPRIMNLVIDAGNTLVKMAVFHRQEIIHIQTSSEVDVVTIKGLLEQYPDIRSCIVGSVRALPETLEGSLPEKLNVHILGPETSLPISHNYSTFNTLGSDRIAGVVAANHLYPGRNVLLVETGTCITYDLIDTGGMYHGGGISPGLHMRFQALHTFTDKLPLVEPADDPALIGNTTKGSILSGVINGLKAEVQGIISRYEGNYENLTIILSGGNLDYFDKNLKNNIFAVPNIVITGLNIILEFNDKN